MFRKPRILVAILLGVVLLSGCSNKVNDSAAKDNKPKINGFETLKGEKLALAIADASKNGELDKAIKLGEEGIKKDPKNLGALLNLSSAYYYKKDLNKMLETAQKMAKIAPKDPIVLNQLAWALIDSGSNLKLGVEKAKEAVLAIQKSGASIDIGYIDTYAYGLSKVGKKKEAIAFWERELAQIENGEVYLHLGQTYLDLGKKEFAKKYLDNGLKLIKLQLKDANLSVVEKNHLKDIKKQLEDKLKNLQNVKS